MKKTSFWADAKSFLLIVSGALALLFIAIRIIDILFAWSLYSRIFDTVQEASGFQDFLANSISVLVTAVAIILLPSALKALLLGRRKDILVIAGAVAAWFLGLYLVSQPAKGEFFNPMTGTARYKYVRYPDGRLGLRPKGYNFDPVTGKKLEELDSDVITPEVMKSLPKEASSSLFELRQPLNITKSTLSSVSFGKMFFDADTPMQLELKGAWETEDSLTLKLKLENNSSHFYRFSVSSDLEKIAYLIDSSDEALHLTSLTGFRREFLLFATVGRYVEIDRGASVYFEATFPKPRGDSFVLYFDAFPVMQISLSSANKEIDSKDNLDEELPKQEVFLINNP